MGTNASTIKTYQENSVLEVILSRPEKRNAINGVMIEEIDNALREVENDPTIRVIVFKAEGAVFSAGHDLSGGPTNRPIVEERFNKELEEYYRKTLYIRDYPKPTIAVVHGACIAAGLMITQACDLVIATPDAYFSNPVARMGGVGAEVLFEPWDMGVRRAKYFLYTGEAIEATQAMEFGMVNEVVDPNNIPKRTGDLAKKIADMPPVTLRLLKKSLNHTQDIMGARESYEYHFALHELGHATEESQHLLHDVRQKSSDVKNFLKQRDEKFS